MEHHAVAAISVGASRRDRSFSSCIGSFWFLTDLVELLLVLDLLDVERRDRAADRPMMNAHMKPPASMQTASTMYLCVVCRPFEFGA